MATFTITNLTSEEIYLGDLRISVKTTEPRILQNRSTSELADLTTTMERFAAGDIAFDVTLSVAEKASGLLLAQNTVNGEDVAEVAAAEVLAVSPTLFKDMAAGGGGSPDDVTIYAAGAVPFKFRVLDAWAWVDSTPGASSVTIRTEAAGAGDVLATFDTGTTGLKQSTTALGTVVVTPGAAIGVFGRRSDDAIDGRVFLLIRRES